MPFKKSTLANWTVERELHFAKDCSLTITVKVVEKSALDEFLKKPDLEAAKGLTVAITGYQDEEGKELGRDKFFEDIESHELPIALAHGIAQKCVDAQYDAAVKN